VYRITAEFKPGAQVGFGDCGECFLHRLRQCFDRPGFGLPQKRLDL
jgi:hypothetical protein